MAEELIWSRTILNAYRELDGRPILRCALVRVVGARWLAEIDEDQGNVVRADLELVCFASLAHREFFLPWPYSNSACFRYYGQRFTPPPEFTALSVRRRDGRTRSGQNLASAMFSRPLQTSTISDVEIDRHLVAALEAFRETAEPNEWVRWFDAIECFNRANSDDESVGSQEEAGLMASAFERLLDARPEAIDVAAKLDRVHLPASPILASSSHRRSPRWTASAGSSLRYEWMREFYILRGTFSHGRRDVSIPLAWSVQEHLAAGGFVFPLLVKMLLSQSGHYSLTRQDQAKVDAFENIIDADFGRPPADSKGSLDTVMTRAVSAASSAIGVRDAVAMFQRLRTEAVQPADEQT